MPPDRPIHESHTMSRSHTNHCRFCGAREGFGDDANRNALATPCPANKLYALEQRVEALEKWKASHREWHSDGANLYQGGALGTRMEIADEPQN